MQDWLEGKGAFAETMAQVEQYCTCLVPLMRNIEVMY
jgi:hypothetical protein